MYPLKISSINGKPSEVQVYVLSPEPLLEKAMLEKKLPLIYSNDLAQVAYSARWRNEWRDRTRPMIIGRFDGVPPDVEARDAVQKWLGRPFPSHHELLPFAKVTNLDLPECARHIPVLAGKSWWLTKQTWTFQPEKMRDLTFESAGMAFWEMLNSQYGYFAGPSLAAFGGDGVPQLLEAMQDPSPVVRDNAASTFNNPDNWQNIYQIIDDPRLANAAPAWLKDQEPSVRMAALAVLMPQSQPTAKFAGPLVALLHDQDASVRSSAIFAAGMQENDPVPDDVLMALLHNSDPWAPRTGRDGALPE